MPLVASTGPVLVRFCQHQTSTGHVLATNGMLTGTHLKLLRNAVYPGGTKYEYLVSDLPANIGRSIFSDESAKRLF